MGLKAGSGPSLPKQNPIFARKRLHQAFCEVFFGCSLSRARFLGLKAGPGTAAPKQNPIFARKRGHQAFLEAFFHDFLGSP